MSTHSSPNKVVNTYADTRYLIPDKIEELTGDRIVGNAFDYDTSDNMFIYLTAQNISCDILEVL